MGGGLIQLTTYTAQDIFLTGNPQITFFKSVYRKHTNFAIETVELPFEGANLAFGETLICRVDKLGDLMSRTTLIVKIPEVAIPRPIIVPDPQLDILSLRMQTAYASYQTIHNYVGLTMAAYRASVGLIQSSNSASNAIVTAKIASTFNTLDPLPNSTIRTAFASLLERDCGVSSASLVSALSLLYQSQQNTTTSMLDKFELVRTQLQLIETKYWNSYQNALKAYKAESGTSIVNTANYAKFAWIRKLGHFIIEWVDIIIGGNRIDRQWGEWINIWHELTASVDQEKGYRDLIGDVPELTNFDTTVKPAYTIATPIPFWYCQDNGLALPLISLNYYDVQLMVKFRKMEELCYTNIPGALDPSIVRIVDASIWMDYVYLDATERRRFAQSSHEYLIRQVQREEYSDFPISQNNFEMHFSNPVKEIVWLHQRDDMIYNSDDTYEPQWDNYTLDRNVAPSISQETILTTQITQSTIDLPYALIPNRDSISVSNAFPIFPTSQLTPSTPRMAINTTQLTLNQLNRTEVSDQRFFENLMTYQHHRSGGIPGVNVLSFADRPEITQPTGSCNMGRLDKSTLNIVFNYDYLYNSASPISGKVRIYALSYNVLRFMSGVCGLAFIYGM
jgi:hypothetical protein